MRRMPLVPLVDSLHNGAANKQSQRAKEALARPVWAERLIADRFDIRTLANMEVALERACENLGMLREVHEVRRHIALRILECAEGGGKTLKGLTEAGRIAATEVSVSHGV